jgi:hypothetical protein
MQYVQISPAVHIPTGKAIALYEIYTVKDPVTAADQPLKRIIGYYNLSDLQAYVAELQAVVTAQTPAAPATPATTPTAAPATPAPATTTTTTTATS